MNKQDIKKHIRTIPDFPIKGIEFYDINSIFENVDVWKNVINEIKSQISELDIDILVGIESRGFFAVSVLSIELGIPFTMARKKGKLPGEIHSYEYELEYGTDTLELQKYAVKQGTKCLIIDDLLATGGTAQATAKLIEKMGAEVVAFSFIIELIGLGGREKCEPIAPIYTFVDFPA